MSGFSLVASLRGGRRRPTRDDPAIFADGPTPAEERTLRLRFRCETACALNQDPEIGASDLRCPECGCRGAWEGARACDGPLVEPDPSDVDCEPYNGRKRISEASSEVWRCNHGHETREPLRPRHEPRGSAGTRGRAPCAGRNVVEDRIVLLCDS